MAAFTVFTSNDGLVWTKSEQDDSYFWLMKKVKERSAEELTFERIRSNEIGLDIACYRNGRLVPLNLLAG